MSPSGGETTEAKEAGDRTAETSDKAAAAGSGGDRDRRPESDFQRFARQLSVYIGLAQRDHRQWTDFQMQQNSNLGEWAAERADDDHPQKRLVARMYAVADDEEQQALLRLLAKIAQKYG